MNKIRDFVPPAGLDRTMRYRIHLDILDRESGQSVSGGFETNTFTLEVGTEDADPFTERFVQDVVLRLQRAARIEGG